jgi:ABC-type phosphate transport system substrate-binding protein
MQMSPPCTAWAGAVVVVAHANVHKIDASTVQRIYTGKAIEVDGVAVQPANLKPGQTLRQRFLNDLMQQAEDAYTGYWTVRRYIGKGAPPRELASVAEVLQFVQNTPGAIAYLDEADVPASVNVVFRK